MVEWHKKVAPSVKDLNSVKQVGIDEYRVVEWHKKVAPSVKDLNSVKQVLPPGPVLMVLPYKNMVLVFSIDRS